MSTELGKAAHREREAVPAPAADRHAPGWGFAGNRLCRRSPISLLGGVRGFGGGWDRRGWTEVRVGESFDLVVSDGSARLCRCEKPRGTGRL